MKLTVAVPVNVVVEILSEMGEKEQAYLDETKVELEKLEKSIIHDPFKEQKVALVKDRVSQMEGNMAALERQKKILGASLDYCFDQGAGSPGGELIQNVSVELSIE